MLVFQAVLVVHGDVVVGALTMSQIGGVING